MKSIILNKFVFFFSDFFEVVKYFTIYIIIILTVGLSYKIIKEEFGEETLKEVYQIIFGVIYLFEIMLYPFNGYNYIYEQNNGIKFLLYFHQISPFIYYLGKFLTDVIMTTLAYTVVLFFFFDFLKLDLKDTIFLKNFMLNFFKLFMWKISISAFTYILAQFFTSIKRFMKFFIFVYFIQSMLFAVMKYYTKFSGIVYFSDSLIY